MTDRITRYHVEGAIRSYRRAGETLGILHPKDDIQLQTGSPQNGRAWRLYIVLGPGTGVTGAPGTNIDGYIGWSAREAYDTVRTIASAWFVVPRKEGTE